MTGSAREIANAAFVGRVGHELRTPLNAILGFSMLLQREKSLTAKQRERISTIEQSGKQLLARIEMFLEQADIAPGDYELDDAGPISVPAVLQSDRTRPRHPPRMSGTVLVVDDTGEEAIAIAREAQPDLVLLDVQMRGMGGFETCSALKADAQTWDIPIIFMTVISDTAAKVAAFEAGAADYVTKPFHPDEALARINTQLRLMHSQKQLARLNSELEARVSERTAQLEAANRELQAFCYSMAHDLRGPLGALDGFSSLLQELLHGEQNSRVRHYLGRIRSGVRQMDALTEALLVLAHLSLREQRGESVDLGELATLAIERLRDKDPQRQVQVDVQPGLQVQADRALLKMLVDHLMDNAWKFTAREPKAVISVGRASKETEDGAQVFYVRDNGTGFDMAYADKLFKPFQRLHGSSDFSGLGIGLAIVERIVMRHGGRVWAEARPGEGATFYFSLGKVALRPKSF